MEHLTNKEQNAAANQEMWSGASAGVPVSKLRRVNPRAPNKETTNGRGYSHRSDEAGAWLKANDPTGHGVKRKGGKEPASDPAPVSPGPVTRVSPLEAEGLRARGELLTVADVARHRGISTKAVEKWIATSGIPIVEVATGKRRVFVAKTDVMALAPETIAARVQGKDEYLRIRAVAEPTALLSMIGKRAAGPSPRAPLLR